jgi:predicted MFS family arabinose efflux permease
VAFTDELATGIIPAGAPELTGSFRLAPSAAAGWTLVAFQLLGVIIEPPLLALARGARVRSLRTLGLSVMALALLAAAAAPTYVFLLAALALYGPASGLGTQLAQAALVSDPSRRGAALARWELLSLAGDLLAPAVLAGSVALGLGWRGALVAVAAVTGLQAVAAARAPGGAGDVQGETGRAPLREALRAARACPALLGWSAATALCGLMDEVLVSFGALWLAGLGMDATARAVVLGAWVVGGMAGAVLLERAGRLPRPATLLLAGGAGSALAFVLWLCARGLPASAALATAAGLFTASHYPLLRGRAFAAMPDRPEVVLAVGSALTAVDLVVPVGIGLVADHAGLLGAMLVLLLQPAGVVAAGLCARAQPGSAADPSARATSR